QITGSNNCSNSQRTQPLAQVLQLRLKVSFPFALSSLACQPGPKGHILSAPGAMRGKYRLIGS
ncbi:MAG: hypothetical protein NTV15_08790, partial [Candidatus Bathyarchaeota archaeon]|nr:hypothetical protein [Candidatus Bathyarchaeota archaeon]